MENLFGPLSKFPQCIIKYFKFFFIENRAAASGAEVPFFFHSPSVKVANTEKVTYTVGPDYEKERVARAKAVNLGRCF